MEELTTLRTSVQQLGARVREACAQDMALHMGADAVGPVLLPPQPGDLAQLPPMPDDMGDATAVERWMEALVVEGEQRGHKRGVVEGRAAAIVRVLALRGILLAESQRERILRCQDDAALHRYLERALQVTTAAELFSP